VSHPGFLLTYDVPDKEVMLLPTYLIWVLWTAIGVRALADVVAPRRALHATTAAVLMLALGATNLVVNLADGDLSDDWSARVQGEAIFASLPPDAVFIGAWYDV